MTKRELISREEALSHPFANGKYDHKNADINFILGHESYKEWLETLPVFTEQDIVKPYLDKIKARIELEKLGYPPSAGYYKAINKCLQIIDKYSVKNEEKE